MRFLVMVLACLMSAPAQAKTLSAPPDLSHPLTLRECLDVALKQQPSLAIAEQSVRASRAGLQQARSSLFPQVTPEWSYTNSESRTTLPGFGSRQSKLERAETNLRLRQLIWNGGRRELSIAQSRQSLESSRYAQEATRQDVVVSVTSAFYNLLRSYDLLKVAQANVDRAQNTVEVTRAQVDAGVAAPKDILQAEADLANAKVNTIQARNRINVAEASLKNAMGLVTDSRIQAAPIEIKVPSPSEKVPSLDEYIQMAYKNRPDLQQLSASIEVSRLSVRLAQLSTKPDLEGDFVFARQFSPDPGNQQTLSASITWPLYDGGNIRAAVEESKANLESTRQRYEQLRQNILLDVEQSYLTMLEARERADASRQAVEAARINYEAALESRRAEVGTIIEIIAAQAALVNAETNYTQAIYDYYIAEAQLRKATGVIGQ